MDSYEVNEKKGERESREDEVRKVLLLNVETLYIEAETDPC